jgi:hypothetical protein
MGDGKRPLGRPRNIWSWNIKMVLNEIEWKCVNRIYMLQDGSNWWAILKLLII